MNGLSYLQHSGLRWLQTIFFRGWGAGKLSEIWVTSGQCGWIHISAEFSSSCLYVPLRVKTELVSKIHYLDNLVSKFVSLSFMNRDKF